MIENARKKIEELKVSREKVVQEADQLEKQSKEKIQKAEDTEAQIEGDFRFFLRTRSLNLVGSCHLQFRHDLHNLYRFSKSRFRSFCGCRSDG